MAKVAQMQLEAAVFVKFEQFSDRRQHAGFAVWRQAHDFVLVAVLVKAEVLGDGLVENPQ
jgi:hypothetical protein